MAFGAGAGESLFGARAGNVLSKATVTLGIVFMANTLVLGVLFAQKDKLVMDPNASAPMVQPAAMQEQPVDFGDLVDTGAGTIDVPAVEEKQDEM
jgi:preprotein translocase subunit SecG